MNALALVPVERLTSRADLFKCEPYRAVITARACLGRQEGARRAPVPGVAASAARNSKCEDCALGARVADRLAAYPDDGSRPVVPTCTAPGRTTPVIGARASQRPLCPEHRKPQEPETMTAKKTDDDQAAEAATTCAAKGCTHPAGGARSNTRGDLAPFCIEHRITIRNRARAFPGGAEAVIAHLREGTLPPPTPLSERVKKGGAASHKGARGRVKVDRIEVEVETDGAPQTVSKKAKPARVPSPAAVNDAAVVEHVTRALAVVQALGGLARAEKIAAAMRVAS